jgi:hypothetical protein
MSLLAESLVEEWLNRKGYFTIRGIKHGIGELDLLGIHRESSGSVTGWHVEVQASFRPVGYIAKLTKEMAHGSRAVRVGQRGSGRWARLKHVHVSGSTLSFLIRTRSKCAKASGLV